MILQIQVQALCAMLALFCLSACPISYGAIEIWVSRYGPRHSRAKAKGP